MTSDPLALPSPTAQDYVCGGVFGWGGGGLSGANRDS